MAVRVCEEWNMMSVFMGMCAREKKNFSPLHQTLHVQCEMDPLAQAHLPRDW